MTHAEIAKTVNDNVVPYLRAFILCGIANDGQKVVVSHADSDADKEVLNVMAENYRIQTVPADHLWKDKTLNQIRLIMKRRGVKQWETVPAEGGYFVRDVATQKLVKP